jgi:acyl-CoA thioester hydrolase
MASEPTPKPLLSDFPVVIVLPVLWGDQDAFGHVNNNAYFRWFESARIEYFQRIGLLEMLAADRIGPILASVACDYRRQLHFPDTIKVGMRATKIGRSSLGLEHVVVSQKHDTVAAEGRSTVVVFDYRAHKSHPIPQALRQAIEGLEGRTFD